MKILILVSLILAAGVSALALYRLRPSLPGMPASDQALRLAAHGRQWMIFLLGGLAASLATLALLDAPGFESSVGYARLMFSRHAGTDSWTPMLAASEHLRLHPQVPVYQAVFFEQHVKFQYPLTALLVLDVPRDLFGVSTQAVVTGWQIASRLCVPLIGVVVGLLFVGASREVDGGPPAAPSAPALASIVGCALLSTLLFYPLARSEYHGQIQTAMTLAVALALLAWQRGHRGWAGVLVALCIAIKPQSAVFVLWALLRRQWRFAAAAALTAALALLAAWALYGWHNLVGYLAVLEFLGRHGESYFINQSVNGLLHRLLFNGVNLDGTARLWSGTPFPPYSRLVHLATVASSALILGVALLWNLRARAPGVLDLALIALALTVASPIAWDHHYGVLLPILAVAVPPAIEYRPWGARTLPLLGVAFALCSQSFNELTNRWAATHWNWVQSYLFFGALLVMALLMRLIAMRPTGESSPIAAPQGA